MRTPLLAATLVFACLARAQAKNTGDTLPPVSPPTSAVPTTVKSAPAGNDKQAGSQPFTAPAPSEGHSPSTLHNAWTAPANLRLTSSAVGGVGLLRVAGADLGARGLLRFSLTGEYFKNGSFPVRDADNKRTAGTFALAYVPFEFLELSASYTASSNSNSRSSPNLIQALGDVTLGARGSHEWIPGLWAGVDLRALFFSGVGDQNVDRAAFGFAPRVIATYELRRLNPKLPLRAHGNLGLVLDGTGDLVSDTRLNASEEYALNVNRFNRLALALGVEAPLRGVTPFLEFNLAYPLGVGGDGLVAPDGQTVSAASAAFKTFNLGAKVTAVRDVTFSVGAEFGLTRAVGLGVPATPPINLFFGAAYTVDLLDRPETRLVEVVREAKPDATQVVQKTPTTPPPSPTPTPQAPQTGQVSGVVLDFTTRKPIAGVLVTVPGAGLPPVATEAGTGRFLTHQLPAGPIRLSAQKEGYRQSEQDLRVTAGDTATVEMLLEAEARPAVFTVSTTAQKKPVAATVSFQGPKSQELPTSDSASAPAKIELPAGHYVVNVVAKGFLAQTRDVQASDGATQALSFELEPEPKKKLVEVKEDRIELAQQIQFGAGKAVILAESQPLISQVVDTLVRGGIKRVRIEGHTDNQGDPAVNLQLSKDRAQAVAAALTKAGIDASRLEVAGFGDTRPIAPNLTPRGRELNRRVELLILEK
ncbi:OmpA family protein [Hyalangium versicolor]|uniref:OmpA family protein n=1 Tax=Hyalangium versicolor TaxID=2861190 RepID=UPI001CCE3354|nr:OmpA family protein [Hyalangium versicolor]